MSSQLKLIKLNNGYTCPIIGLGTSHNNNEEVIYQSIKDGTRLIDTAAAYKNEEEVGRAIKKAIDEKIVKREDLFIITKLNIPEKEDPETAIRNSLKRLQLNYVDLYLDHWPSFNNYKEPGKYKLVPVEKTWATMEKLVELGLTKSIGVSNYNVQNLLNLLSFCKIKPTFNEVEFHPYLFQKGLKEFCDKENIKILSYNPLIKGSYCLRSEKIMKERNLNLFNEPVVLDLAKAYSKTPGQIILNWHIHIGVIPIPGTKNPNRMKENLCATDFTMKEEEYEKLSSFEDKQYRFCDSIAFAGLDVFA